MAEIVDSIKQQLESEGALNAIRAQLKACVLGVLASASAGEDGPKATSRASTFVEDKTGRVAMDLVKELLDNLGLKNTLAVLNTELGASSPRTDRDALMKELDIDTTSLPNGGRDPLLAHLLARPAAKSSPVSAPRSSPSPLREQPTIFTSLQAVPHGSSSSSSSSGGGGGTSRPISPIDSTKSLSQRRAISLSVSPDAAKSSSKSPTLSPVSLTSSGDLGKPRSPNLPAVEARNRMGVLNPLPQQAASVLSKAPMAKEATTPPQVSESRPEEPEEETDSREFSSSFEVDSPEHYSDKTGSFPRKARHPLSRVVEVQSKSPLSTLQETTSNTMVQRVSRGAGDRAKSGWGATTTDRDGTEGDFVFAEEEEEGGGGGEGGDSSRSASISNRRLSPLSNRAGRGGLPRSNPVDSVLLKSVEGKAQDELLEQSGSFGHEDVDVMQASHVSNQEEEHVAAAPVPSRQAPLAAKAKDEEEYDDDEFEDIEEDISIEEQSSDDSNINFDESSELSPPVKPTGSLSRTKSGFMETVGGKKKTSESARRHNSDDEADDEAQEESSPSVISRKMPQQTSQSPTTTAPSGWAKTQSAGARKPSAGARGKHGDAIVADLDEHSVASEDIDALEFSAGGADSDSNGSFSFLNDDSIASHKAARKGVGVNKSAAGRSIPPLKAKGGGNLSEDSADIEFSVQEQELSTSGHGAFDGYDHSVPALPPVKGKEGGGW